MGFMCDVKKSVDYFFLLQFTNVLSQLLIVDSLRNNRMYTVTN